jgi:hypothetical protein
MASNPIHSNCTRSEWITPGSCLLVELRIFHEDGCKCVSVHMYVETHISPRIVPLAFKWISHFTHTIPLNLCVCVLVMFPQDKSKKHIPERADKTLQTSGILDLHIRKEVRHKESNKMP